MKDSMSKGRRRIAPNVLETPFGANPKPQGGFASKAEHTVSLETDHLKLSKSCAGKSRKAEPSSRPDQPRSRCSPLY